ncbi:hypothetical protein [Verrucomicrobium spinosum]|uniref:hypothetical protein n=1 Tax=Verrucomicrobium spinosum TaxID=2736 RepID=UPI0012E293EA|nr:hypothetical protein [Verrucomicrobium spinosum]
MKPRHLLYTSAFALLGLPALAQSTSPAPAAGATELDTVTVSATRDAAVTYTAPVSATGGLKTDTPLLETPQPSQSSLRPLSGIKMPPSWRRSSATSRAFPLAAPTKLGLLPHSRFRFRLQHLLGRSPQRLRPQP